MELNDRSLAKWVKAHTFIGANTTFTEEDLERLMRRVPAQRKVFLRMYKNYLEKQKNNGYKDIDCSPVKRRIRDLTETN